MWGPFDIEHEIGRGAFGTVYQAVDRNLQLTVALKVIRPFAPAVVIDANRAFREARLLAQINHPNVVRVFRAERVGAEVGVSMELIKGVTLSQLIREQGRLDPREAMTIGRDLCRALGAVHDAGMVHGDLKSRNVMREDGGRTVLMDFGACRLAPTNGPRMADRISGTPLYLAPEIFAGSAPTVASDISLTICRNNAASFPSMGENQPPPDGLGASPPVSRYRARTRLTVARPTPRRSAAWSYVRPRVTTARTMARRTGNDVAAPIPSSDHGCRDRRKWIGR